MALNHALARARRGAALPGVLLVVSVLVSVSGWLIGHLRDDVAHGRLSRSFEAQDALAAAAVTAVAERLGLVPDWQVVGGFGAGPACPAVAAPPVAVDADVEHAWAQAETLASSRWAADAPHWHLVWQCHAAGVLGRWPSPGPVPSVLVWVADDPEGDGLPSVDGNQRLLLRALAVGPMGGRGLATATIARTSPGAPVRLVSWRPRAVG